MQVSPTVRFDTTTNEWVAFSPRRSGRPHQEGLGEAPSSEESWSETCPFCPGHEALTPQEVFRVGDSAAWRVRVVPNMYAAFASPEGRVGVRDSTELFPELPAAGTHEVIVESPHHCEDLRRLPEARVVDLFHALHARYCTLASTTEVSAIVIFKNKGIRAGTSLRHPHWQLIATEVMPPSLERQLDVAEAHFRRSAQCLHSELLRAEEQAKARLVEVTANYVAFVPFASAVPYQVRIQPRRQKASWDELSVDELLPLATLLPNVLRRVDAELEQPDFNITITCAPPQRTTLRSFSWHLDVVPRTSVDGGFELGSGMKINTVLPEQAAAALRSRG